MFLMFPQFDLQTELPTTQYFGNFQGNISYLELWEARRNRKR